MAPRLLTFACVCGLGAAILAFVASRQHSTFVTREGTHLRARGAEFRFVGTNIEAIHGLRARERLDALYTALEHDGITVVRLWALGEAENCNEAWRRDYALRCGENDWVESSFVALDQALALAAQHRMRVVVVLGNRWADYGGLPQYARWVGQPPRGRDLLPSELAALYRSREFIDLYAESVRRVVGRRNTVTGGLYRDDPSILAWELINEGSAESCATTIAFGEFARAIVAEIRALDANDLIASGYNTWTLPQTARLWTELHRSDLFDLVDLHVYPQWHAAVRDERSFTTWLAHRIDVARSVGKPFLAGELGFPRRWSIYSPRAAFFETTFTAFAANDAAGVLVWAYRHDATTDAHAIGVAPGAEIEFDQIRASVRRASRLFSDTSALRTQPRAPTSTNLEERPLVAAAFPHEWNAQGEIELDLATFEEGCTVGTGSAFLRYFIANPRGFADAADLRVSVTGGAVGVQLNGAYLGNATPSASLRVLRPSFEEGAWLELRAADAATRTAFSMAANGQRTSPLPTVTLATNGDDH